MRIVKNAMFEVFFFFVILWGFLLQYVSFTLLYLYIVTQGW